MKSGTSCCERGGWFSTALLRKNITRFSPIWGIYTLILFVSMPLPLFMSYLGNYGYGNLYLNGFLMSSVGLGVVYGIVMAMGLFSYLMNARAAHLLHSLPIRREGLFLTNWVSGALFALVPNLIIALLTAVAVLLVGDGEDLLLLGLWFAVTSAVELFFFAMAIFCAMCTGNLLALPVFYGILNLLAMGIHFVIGTAVELLTVGISLNLDFSVTQFLTPVYFFAERLGFFWGTDLPMEDFLALLAYALIGCLIFSLLALAIYRLRQLERAGDLITVGWMRPVFQTCMGMGLGMLLGWVTYVGFFQDQGYREWLFIVLAVFWTVFFTVAARMLLKKTLRVWRSGWKSFVLTGLVMVLLLVGIRIDLPGRQHYVPQADEVSRIDLMVNGNFSYYLDLKEEEQIREVTEIHEAITKRLDLVRLGSDSYSSYEEYTGEEPRYQTESDTRIRISYWMKNGSLVERYYNLMVRAEDLTDPASAASRLEAFLNQPDLAYLRHFEDRSEGEVAELTAVSGSIYGYEGGYIGLTPDTAQMMLYAARSDINAGRIRVSLLWDQDAQENDYMNCELVVTEPLRPEDRVVLENGEVVNEPRTSYINLPIQHSCTSMLEVVDILTDGMEW